MKEFSAKQQKRGAYYTITTLAQILTLLLVSFHNKSHLSVLYSRSNNYLFTVPSGKPHIRRQRWLGK